MEKILSFPVCGSRDFVKNGHLASGAQNHKCKACGRQFVAEPKQKLIETHTREQIQIALRWGFAIVRFAKCTMLACRGCYGFQKV